MLLLLLPLGCGGREYEERWKDEVEPGQEPTMMSSSKMEEEDIEMEDLGF
jgi:hypothetical protein